MKKNNKMIIILWLAIVAFHISSCKKDNEVGGTLVERMAGDWLVTVNDGDELYEIYSYNTSDNNATQMWIDAPDLTANGLSIHVKGKIGVDLGNQLFSGNNVSNILTGTASPTFSIAKGKIITNGTVGPISKTPTDLISFDLIINNATYQIKGYHKTGFISDLPE